MKKLREYQSKSLGIFSRDTSGLDASDLGTGKTLVAVERARSLEIEGRPPRILVVSPVNTHRQWEETFAEQYPSLAESDMLRIVGTHKKDGDSWEMILAKQPGVFIMSWEAMRGSIPRTKYREFYKGSGKHGKLSVKAIVEATKNGDVPPWSRTGTWDLVVADEVHRIQRRDSVNRMILRRIKTKYKLALSGTPAGNKPEGLWSVLEWLWPERYPSFWDWAQKWLHITDKPIGGGNTAQVVGGEKYPGSIWTDIPTIVRWRVEDVAHQIPSAVERIVLVPMGPKQRKIYDDFETQAFAWLDGQPIGTPLPLTQRIRLRQAALGQLHAGYESKQKRVTIPVWLAEIPVWSEDCQIGSMRRRTGGGDCRAGSMCYTRRWEGLEIGFTKTGEHPKLESVKDIVSDLPEGEKVIVYTHSARWAHMAAEVLEKTCGPARAWTGGLTAHQRQHLKQEFCHGSVRVLVAQIASVAEGTDGLQYACSCEIWASPSEDGLMNKQARGRLERMGQERPVQRWILHSEDSIDTVIDVDLRYREAQMDVMYRKNRS